MDIEKTLLPGVLLIKPKVFADDRGFFYENYQAQRYKEAGIDLEFCQDNHSRSSKGVLRGLHYQKPNEQGKLVVVLQGDIFDVAVDIRPDSPTYKQWVGVTLTGENHHQLYIPPGFAHGFCVLSDTADFYYKCTAPYSPKDDKGIRFDDPEIQVQWPLECTPVLSPKDEQLPLLCEVDPSDLPTMEQA